MNIMNIAIELTREEFFKLHGDKDFVAHFSEAARNAIYDHICATQWEGDTFHWDVIWHDVFMDAYEDTSKAIITHNRNELDDIKIAVQLLGLAALVDDIPKALLENHTNLSQVVFLDSILDQLIENNEFADAAAEVLVNRLELNYQKVNGGWVCLKKGESA